MRSATVPAWAPGAGAAAAVEVWSVWLDPPPPEERGGAAGVGGVGEETPLL